MPTLDPWDYPAEQLRGWPTLATGQTCDLKLDTGQMRLWVSRCSVEDGEPYPDKVTVEHLVDGRWVVTREYAG